MRISFFFFPSPVNLQLMTLGKTVILTFLPPIQCILHGCRGHAVLRSGSRPDCVAISSFEGHRCYGVLPC